MVIVGRLLITILVIGCLAAAARTRAQSPNVTSIDDSVLAALVEEALAANPDVTAAAEAAKASAARPAQARSLPIPMFSAVFTNDGWSPSLGTREMTTLAFMGSQDLPFPGKRQLRADISSREAEEVSEQVRRVRLSIVAAVNRGYYGLLLNREQLELVREQEQIWEQTESIARSRYVVGQGAQQDVLRVQIEVTRIEQVRTDQTAQIEIRVAELNRLLGRTAQAPIETHAPLSLRPFDRTLDDALEWLEGISPELTGC